MVRKGKSVPKTPSHNLHNYFGSLPDSEAARAPPRERDSRLQGFEAANAPQREIESSLHGSEAARAPQREIESSLHGSEAARAPNGEKEQKESERPALAMKRDNASVSSSAASILYTEASAAEKENLIPGSKKRAISGPADEGHKGKRVKGKMTQASLSQIPASEVHPGSTAVTPDDYYNKEPVDVRHPQRLLEDDADEDDKCPHDDYCEQVQNGEQYEVQDVQEDQLVMDSLFISDEERYQNAGIELGRVEEYQENFHAKMKSIIEFLFDKAKKTEWRDLATQTSWFARSTFHQFKNASSDAIVELFQEVIPRSTRAILGKEPLTKELFLALPRMACNEKGAYLCYVTEHSMGDGIYSGSSTDDCDNRECEHRRQIVRAQSLDPVQVKGTFYKYMAECPTSKANFRLVAMFAEDKGFDAAGFAWLIRLLETVMMIMFDTFEAERARPTYTVSRDELDMARSVCGIQTNQLKRLNAALSIKQQIKSPGMRECSNCPETSNGVKKIHWFYDWDTPLATNFLCEACWQYKKRTGKDRPRELWEVSRAHPKTAKCSNPECGVELIGSTMQWHLDKANRRAVCKACYEWACSHDGQNRPKEIVTRKSEPRVCARCKTKSGNPWRWRKNESGEYMCLKCHAELNNPEQNARRKADKVCADCGNENPKVWKPATGLCGQCDQVHSELRKKRNRATCWNCQCNFSKSQKLQKRWAVSLREYICDACFRTWDRDRFLRVQGRELEGLDIRCGLCQTQYSARWGVKKFEGENCLECGRCEMSLNKNANRKNFNSYHHEQKTADKKTYAEHHTKSQRKLSTPEFFEWLYRVHGIDRSRGFIEAAKRAEDDR